MQGLIVEHHVAGTGVGDVVAGHRQRALSLDAGDLRRYLLAGQQRILPEGE